MGRQRDQPTLRTLERGELTFLYRPRIEETHPEDSGDVQRLLLVLAAEGGVTWRVLAIGRKRLPRARSHDRYWGFVDAVLHHPYDVDALLAAQTYGTKTHGVRHLPAARPAGSGVYRFDEHGGHTHFRYRLVSTEDDDPVVSDLGIAESGDAIVTVANPDPTAWGLNEAPPLQYELFDELEVHVTVPAPFPPRLQERFGERRYAPLDTMEWLDCAGAELVFVEAAD